MRSAWKILAGIGAVLVAAFVAVAIVVATLDVNTLIGPVKSRIKAATGRDLVVNGSASFSLSLTPRLVVEGITLSNAPWAASPQMLDARRLEISVELLPLLSRRFEVVELRLVDPVIALETDGRGRSNWEMPASATGPGRGDPSTPDDAVRFGVGSFVVSGGALTFRSGAAGSVTAVAIERLSIRSPNVASPIAVEFRGRIDDVPAAVEGRLGSLEQLLAKRGPYPLELKGEFAGQRVSARAGVRAESGKISLDDLQLVIGPDTFAGTLAVVTGGARPKYVFALKGTSLAPLAFAPLTLAHPPPMPASIGTAPATRARLFTDAPIDLALFRKADAEGSLVVDRLALPGGIALSDLRAELVLADGRLQARNVAVEIWGGTIGGEITIDAHDPKTSAIAIVLEGRDLDLGAMLKTAGVSRDLRGGRTRISTNLRFAGASPRAWAASASGVVLAEAGTATLPRSGVELAGTLNQVFDAVNPFRKRGDQTELVCAVARLPLKLGIARIDHSLAIETDKVGISASGVINLRDETIDLAIQPRARKSVNLDIPQLAELVRVSGPMTSPGISIDPVGSAKVLASIGAAIGTGGLSTIGQTLYSWSEGQGPGPCAVAKGGPAAGPGAAAKPGAAVPLADEFGKAVGRLLGK